MDDLTRGALSVKLSEACDCDISSAAYSFIPAADEDVRLYTHSLHNLPSLIDSSIEIFTGKKTDVAKSSIYYKHLKKEQENILKRFNDVSSLVNAKGNIKIKDGKHRDQRNKRSKTSSLSTS